MLVVTGIIIVEPADAAAARAAAARVAAITRTEDGCGDYAFYEDVETPGRFRVYEEWRDQEALTAHLKSPHIAEFRAQLATLSIRSRDVRKMTGCKAEPL